MLVMTKIKIKKIIIWLFISVYLAFGISLADYGLENSRQDCANKANIECCCCHKTKHLEKTSSQNVDNACKCGHKDKSNENFDQLSNNISSNTIRIEQISYLYSPVLPKDIAVELPYKLYYKLYPPLNKNLGYLSTVILLI